MAQPTVLALEKREAKGSRAAARLRAAGRVPGIVYGHGQEPLPVAASAHDLGIVLAHGTHVVDASIDGKTGKLLIKDVQYDHLGKDVVHVDLTHVSLDERVTVTVPITLRGHAPGTNEGGVLSQHLNEIEVECLVTEIPEEIRVSVASLGIGGSVRVADLPELPGLEYQAEPEAAVATVTVVAEEAPAEEVEAEAEAEPEVIGRGAGEEGDQAKEAEPGERKDTEKKEKKESAK